MATLGAGPELGEAPNPADVPAGDGAQELASPQLTLRLLLFVSSSISAVGDSKRNAAGRVPGSRGKVEEIIFGEKSTAHGRELRRQGSGCPKGAPQRGPHSRPEAGAQEGRRGARPQHSRPAGWGRGVPPGRRWLRPG